MRYTSYSSTHEKLGRAAHVRARLARESGGQHVPVDKDSLRIVPEHQLAIGHGGEAPVVLGPAHLK